MSERDGLSQQTVETGQLPTPYAISVQEFTQPTTPAVWKPSEPVARNTLMSFFIGGFARSQGIGTAQLTEYEWTKVKYGFDYLATFANLQEAGGYKALTIEEQDAFLSAHNKVDPPNEGHSHSPIPQRIPDREWVLDKINTFLKNTLQRSQETNPPQPLIPIDRLANMSWEELTKELREQVKQKKRERADFREEENQD